MPHKQCPKRCAKLPSRDRRSRQVGNWLWRVPCRLENRWPKSWHAEQGHCREGCSRGGLWIRSSLLILRILWRMRRSHTFALLWQKQKPFAPPLGQKYRWYRSYRTRLGREGIGDSMPAEPCEGNSVDDPVEFGDQRVRVDQDQGDVSKCCRQNRFSSSRARRIAENCVSVVAIWLPPHGRPRIHRIRY